MLYLVAITLGILAGLVCKGKISRLMELRFEKVWVILGAFIIQIITQAASYRGFELAVRYSMIAYGVSYTMLLVGFWFNRSYIGIRVLSLGCLLNGLVIILNNGKMPVSVEALQKAGYGNMIELIRKGFDGKHSIIGPDTRLAFLSDTMHPPYFLSMMMQVISIGDIIVLIGLLFIVFEVVTGRKPGACEQRVGMRKFENME